MPNLTGDFDVVVEFSVLAANRVLAAMHAGGRFLHSLSLKVNDNPPPGTRLPGPSVGGSVDIFGDAVPNQRRIGLPPASPGPATAAIPRISMPDPVVNATSAVFQIPPVTPSKLSGRAQLQLSPPALAVPDASGANLSVSMQVMSRYFPDPNTSPLAEFIRGQLQLNAPVSQFNSNAANVVEIDIRSSQVQANFNPLWTSRGTLSPDDLAGINQLIRNAIRTGFLPSSNPLPAQIAAVQFKTLMGNPSAIGILLDMAGSGTGTGNPATVTQNFLSPGDDFALGIGANFLLTKLQFSAIPNQSVPLYNLSFQSPSVTFQEGQITLTIKGHAEGSHWYSPPAFDFSASQAFKFNLVSTTGGPLNTAELVTVGGLDLEPTGIGWLVDLFEGGTIQQQRDANLAAIQPYILAALDINTNLGNFLNSILKPPDQSPPLPPGPTIGLAYTSVGIHAGGIVLRGPLTVPAWPAVHVEFQQIPVNIPGPLGGLVGAGSDIGGPDYSALNSWIPGGTIQEFDWYHRGDPQPYVDLNKFVLLHSGPVATTAASVAAIVVPSFTPPGVASTGIVSGYSPLCLTVKGVRVSSSGPEVMQTVTGSQCGISTFPVVTETGLLQAKGSPIIALVQAGPQGSVQVVGHAPALTGANGNGIPNVVAFFPDDNSLSQLEVIAKALRESGRNDAVTAIVAVLTPDQLSKTPYVPGVVYAEDRDNAWGDLYGLKSAQRPVLLIVSPKGSTVWHHEGAIDTATLAAVLRKSLTRGGATAVGVPRLGLRNGATPPNLAFNYAPDRELTLAKVRGPGILVFCSSLSSPSLEAVRDAQRVAEKSRALVLAIYDGETPEAAKRSAVAKGFSAIVVPDPSRTISRAYGVSLVPTTVYLDKSGLVRQVQYGRSGTE
jgi:hypothetical protein